MKCDNDAVGSSDETNSTAVGVVAADSWLDENDRSDLRSTLLSYASECGMQSVPDCFMVANSPSYCNAEVVGELLAFRSSISQSFDVEQVDIPWHRIRHTVNGEERLRPEEELGVKDEDASKPSARYYWKFAWRDQAEMIASHCDALVVLGDDRYADSVIRESISEGVPFYAPDSRWGQRQTEFLTEVRDRTWSSDASGASRMVAIAHGSDDTDPNIDDIERTANASDDWVAETAFLATRGTGADWAKVYDQRDRDSQMLEGEGVGMGRST